MVKRIGVLLAVIVLLSGCSSPKRATSSKAGSSSRSSSADVYPETGFGGYHWVGTLSETSAAWHVPAISDTSTPGDAAIWIGIQSVSGNNEFVQVGIIVTRTASGLDRYRAFWSDVAHHYLPQDLGTVAAGDLVSARIFQAGERWTVAFTDHTRTMSRSVATKDAVRRTAIGAEWILEDPSPTSSSAVDFPFPQISPPVFTQLDVDGAAPPLTAADGQVLMTPNGIRLVPTAVQAASFTFYQPTGAALAYLNLAFSFDRAFTEIDVQRQTWSRQTLTQRQVDILGLAQTVQSNLQGFESTEWPAQAQPAMAAFKAQLLKVSTDIDNWNAGVSGTTFPVSYQEQLAFHAAAQQAREALGLPTGG